MEPESVTNKNKNAPKVSICIQKMEIVEKRKRVEIYMPPRGNSEYNRIGFAVGTILRKN